MLTSQELDLVTKALMFSYNGATAGPGPSYDPSIGGGTPSRLGAVMSEIDAVLSNSSSYSPGEDRILTSTAERNVHTQLRRALDNEAKYVSQGSALSPHIWELFTGIPRATNRVPSGPRPTSDATLAQHGLLLGVQMPINVPGPAVRYRVTPLGLVVWAAWMTRGNGPAAPRGRTGAQRFGRTG